jgi:cobalt/nickel transport system permease protein
MLGVHAFIGIGEALITAGALAFIIKTRPDLLSDSEVRGHGGRGWIVAGAGIALLTVLLAPFASASPDGLERVAGNLGFIDAGQNAPYQIFPDYTIPFLGETPLSTILAGAIGALVVGVVVVLVVNLLRRTPGRTPRVSQR